MSVKVCKFGGTSMADGNVIKSVKKIIESDGERRFIVVSAPGKRYSEDKKVTDLLLECHRILLKEGNAKNGFAPVRARFVSIARELDSDLDINFLLDETERLIGEKKSEDYTASRGEYLIARIFAKVLGAEFVDAERVIFFKPNGEVDADKTFKAVNEICSGCGFAVFPGFYGRGADGSVKTFGRGGSDITGAVIARAVYASVYENWTDVSGFFACDPRIVDSPKQIRSLSYGELRELSFMGANVLHTESVFPVQEANIPIKIKNTFRPQDEGTDILPLSRFFPDNKIITGISGKKNYAVVKLEKSMSGAGGDFSAAALGILNDSGIKAEQIATCVDCLSFAVGQSVLEDRGEEITEKLKAALSPDSVRIIKNVALVAAVGHGLNSSVGMAARIFTALAAEEINVKFIGFGASKINLTVGVDGADFEKCIKAIYREFFD